MVSFTDNKVLKGVAMSEKKKCGCLCRIFKCLLWCVVGLLALSLLLVVTLPLWISPVATGIAGGLVPKFTGTGFAIERFCVNPWSGTVRISGVRLANPDGFGSAPALSVRSFALDVSISELFGNRLHVRDLVIEDAFASYYSHKGTNNMDVILSNVDKAIASDGEKKEASAPEEKQKSEMKFIIDHVRIAGTKVKLMKSDIIPPLPIVDIEMRDVGKESGGATFGEVAKAFTDAFVKALTTAGEGLGALGGAIGSGIKDASSAVGNAASSTKKAVGAVGDTAAAAAEETKTAVKSVGGATTTAVKGAATAVKSVGETATTAVGGAVKTVGDTATSAVGGAKAAVDAVGDTAKKTTEGVKNLFKSFGK